MNKKVDALLQEYLNQNYFSGAVCKIVQGGMVIHENAYGYAAVTPDTVTMTTDTIFDVASLTKIVTATIVLRLVTEGKLDLSQTLDQYFDLRDATEELRNRCTRITVAQLLTHSSGLIDWYPFYTRKEQPFFEILDHVISTSGKVDGVLYSDLNFMLLGLLISNVTDKTLAEALEEYVTIPLELPSMTYSPPLTGTIAATEYGNRIEQEMVSSRGLEFAAWRSTDQAIQGKVNDGNAFYYFDGVAGHAGLFSDVSDIISVGQLYLNKGEWRGQRLIDSRWVQESMTEQVSSRGLGWQVSSLYPSGCGHTGFTGTSLWLCPEKEAVVTLFTNRLHTAAPKNIQDVRKELHELVYSQIK